MAMTAEVRSSGDHDGTSELFDLAQDFLCVIGSDGHFKRLNPTWSRTLGYTSVELMKIPFLDFVHPDDRPGTERRAGQITPEAPLDYFENRYRCKDGSYRLIAWSAAARAEPAILFAVGRDITDQRRAERELAQRASRQSVVLELTRAGLEGFDTGVFLAQAIDLVTRGTETQLGEILAVRPSGDSFERVATFGFSHGIGEDPVSPGRPELEVDLMAGDLRFAVALDYQRNSNLHRSHSLIEHGVVNSMTVGVYGSTSPFGILTVHSTIAREFSPDDLQFMELASTTISVAVERQRGRQQQKMLLGRLVDAQEAERNGIAIKIHDDAVQVMTAVNLRGALFQRALTNPAQIDAARELQETVSLAIGRLRNLLVELRPPALDRHGLAAGFKTHLDHFQAVTGVRCEFTAELDDEPVPEVRILLFRIFQEALTNVRKHANAESVVVSLTSVDGGVRMRVTDDGDGCPRSALEPRVGHLGVAAMRERAEMAGGWWGLTSERGHGSEVSTWIPVAPDIDVLATRAAEAMGVV